MTNGEVTQTATIISVLNQYNITFRRRDIKHAPNLHPTLHPTFSISSLDGPQIKRSSRMFTCCFSIEGLAYTTVVGKVENLRNDDGHRYCRCARTSKAANKKLLENVIGMLAKLSMQ